MKNFRTFVSALEYIEQNLCSPITQEDIASACFCSLSSLQKLWRYCTHSSLKEYISKRRLTKCAEEIARSKFSITEIALKYQYNSPEVFTRAFTKLWGVPPSKFKSEWRFTGIYPKLDPEITFNGGNYMGKRVNISELYDELKSKAGTYVLCLDIVGLLPINENIGRNAGDKVILEAFRRIDKAAGDDMTAFRIGGDEFVIVTGYTDKSKVLELANSILSQNGNAISCDGKDIPVSLHAGATVYTDKHFRYSDLYAKIMDTIRSSQETEKDAIYFD